MEIHSHIDEQLETDLLVVGGGIAGISTALETAETGFRVILLEKEPFIGGRVSQLNQYFPKLCPPSCGLEINIRRLRDNTNIDIITLGEVANIEGGPGNFNVSVIQKARFVNNRCTTCGDCSPVCPVERNNSFNFNIDKTKAIYINHENAYPQKYVIDPDVCLGESCSECVKACKYEAIDLKQSAKQIIIKTKAIVWATGWNPYDANKLEYLGYGKYPEVITNMMFERYSAPNGPTKGKIIVPGTNREIEKIAFVQCAGSRDELHLEYCSSICCLASMKQAQYVREQYPNAEIDIFYIDLRAQGLLEDFYTKTKKDEKISFHRGKVAKVFKDETDNKLVVEAENTLEGKLHQKKFDMVVLATGMEPSAKKNGTIIKDFLDDSGFVKTDENYPIIGCGVSTSPKEVASVVQESTGAALKAIHLIKGGN
jgi:quinone-modifying oxidoreductase subunit QmoA